MEVRSFPSAHWSLGMTLPVSLVSSMTFGKGVYQTANINGHLVSPSVLFQHVILLLLMLICGYPWSPLWNCMQKGPYKFYLIWLQFFNLFWAALEGMVHTVTLSPLQVCYGVSPFSHLEKFKNSNNANSISTHLLLCITLSGYRYCQTL